MAAVRIAMLAAALAAAALAVSGSLGGGDSASTERYRCPMHAKVDSSAPASCPICGMALVRAHLVAVAPAAGHDAAPPPVVRVERRTFSEAIRVPAWVEPDGGITALVYRDDLIGVAPGQSAVMYPARDPLRGLDVAITADPALEWDGATALVHLRARRPEAHRPGDQGVVVFTPRPRALQVVPASAVLDAPEGPYVLAFDSEGEPQHRQVSRRRVQIGRARRGVVAVLSGLSDGEPIVATGAFFHDVEVGAAEPRAAR